MEEALLYDINTRRSDDDLVGVYSTGKGKGTKRPRSQPQPSTISSASSVEVSGTTTAEEEEEDMANCLILLAQGRPLESPAEEEKFTSRRFTVAAITTAGKAGFYVYQCKTCNKCFPSFQALGGHRTRHKKPKVTPVRPADGKKPVVVEDDMQIGMDLFSKTVVAPGHGAGIGTFSKKAKVHVCSICGSEFSSGQALGGHMRRHRPLPAAAVSEVKKERRVLSLDLNLPAQSDDDLPRSPPTMAFFESNPPLVLSDSVIVDCHN